jgi:hypothetical protein
MQPPRKRLPSHRLRSGILCCGLSGLIALSGCTLCCSPYDYDYGGFVSKTPRTDMKNGRVGSIFSDPGLTETIVVESVEPANVDVDGVEIPDPVHLDD